MVTGSSLDSGPSRYVLNELDGRALVRTGPSVRAWITAAFALALLVVVVVALVSYESTADLVAAEELVNHTYEVLAVLESIGSSIAVAHSGVQAYALTGDERFLTGYELSIRAAWAGVDALRTLSADNPEEMDNVGRIEPSIDRLAGWLGETVAVRRDQSLAAAIARVRTHEGEDLARSLRGLLAETETVERTLLARRTTATGQTASRTLWIIQLGGAVGFVIVLAASLVIGREVDRRRRMGLVLQASELRYRVAGIVRVRLDGRMVECNPAYVRMLGYESQAEVLDLNVRDVYANPEDCERVLASLRTPTGWMDVGLRLRRKDGTPIWVSSTVMETFDGEDSGYETIVIDITERKEVDDDIRALRESLERRVADLDGANRDLDAFSYSISHDLRAPLRAMQGFAETLLEDYGSRLDAAGRDCALRIVAASRRMDQLILDLLAFSRLSRAELRLEPISLETVVDDVCAALEPELKDRQAEIVVERPLPRVMAHRPILSQMLTNLLTNALKFVPPDHPPRIRIWSGEGAVGTTRLWMEDNGIGIAPEHQERIFRPFERLHGGSKYPGTGIGLAIVAKAAERLGGRVGVESQPGSGSRFWLELARVKAAR